MFIPYYLSGFNEMYEPIFFDDNQLNFGKRYCRSNVRRLRKIKLKRIKKAFR